MELKLRSRPLAWIDGRPVWPFAGAEGEAEGGETGGAQGGSGGTGGAQGGTTSDGSGTGGETKKDGDGERQSSSDTVSRDEFERIRNQLSAADKKREEAEKRAKEFEDKDKGELEKATERADSAEKRVQALEGQLADLRLGEAMLTDPTYGADKWHDVEDVLYRLRRAVEDEGSAVSIAEDGTVKGVSAFLKTLATNKKHLLKTPAQGAGGGASGDAANRDRRNGASEGGDGGGGRKSAVSSDRRKVLEENYPSLRR